MRANLTQELFRLTSDINLHNMYPDFDESYPAEDKSIDAQSILSLKDMNDKLFPGYLETLTQHQIATQVSAIDTFDLYVAAVA